MCAEFEQHRPALQAWTEILADWPTRSAREDHRVFPRDAVATLDAEGWQPRHWSLIPPWADAPRLKFSTFNARAETLADKPVFRHAWGASQRCLIPASAWFEWGPSPTGKQRHRITETDGGPLVMAGLWEHWERDGESVDSCTVITQPANAQLQAVHGRMPVLLTSEQVDRWLHESPEDCAELICGDWSRPLRIDAAPRKAERPEPLTGDLFAED